MKKRILITGATGKVGQVVIKRLLNDSRFDDFVIRALCHNRLLPPEERLEIVRGSIDKREIVELIMKDVSHLLHLATSKETPENIMDVAVKCLFWLLEASRTSKTLQQFILIGGMQGLVTSITRTLYP